ncbi:MAG: poly-gamma-glutamate hydrolase family protein [Terrimicrobiaceae bacterium]
MEDKYDSMTELYEDPENVEGTTYGKRWRRHEWIQIVEAQATDNPEGQTIVLAIHGGGIEGGTSEIALAVAGYHPATFAQAADCLGLHDLWIFEGLLGDNNSKLHVTSTNYNDPIALKLVQISKRCLSLHGLSDTAANGKIQLGGRDEELRSIVLEELTRAGIPAAISDDEDTNGSNLDNICNKTTSGAGVQLEMGFAYRASLFAPGCNTRELRKNNTNANFCILVTALRKALSRVF